ncbi:MAG: TRAP transporter substrate-binding protein [Oscillospiraceae bacterium]|nr:TRAP transporter substrate-binding protein [Oscillospiraceae bacterium]
MKLKKLIALAASAALALSLFAGCSRPSDNKPNDNPPPANSGSPAENTSAPDSAGPIVIKIGHTDSSTRSTHVWSVWLGEWLEEKAPGRFKVEVYPDGQLGDSPDMVAGVKLGTLQMEFDLSSVVSSMSGPASSCIDLPFLYPTYEDWVEGTFENGGLELFNETLAGSGYYCIGMYYNGMRSVISRTGNYHNSDDLKGQKVRIAQDELNIEMWTAMGANPTPMSWGEVLTSLSTNTIDALDHSLGVFNDFSIHEIAPYVTITNHASSPFPIVCSLDWINSLSPEDRALLEEGVTLACQQQRDEERANEMDYIQRFTDEGATVEYLTDEEVAAFIESVQPVYDKWREKVGDEMVDRWLATVPQH